MKQIQFSITLLVGSRCPLCGGTWYNSLYISEHVKFFIINCLKVYIILPVVQEVEIGGWCSRLVQAKKVSETPFQRTSRVLTSTTHILKL
jgi:hypothetical protein